MHALRRAALSGELETYFTGSTIKHFPRESVLKFQFPIAPLPEQHRIIGKVDSLLEQANRARDRLDRVPLILKRFRQAVLAAACSGELTTEWRGARRGLQGQVRALLQTLGTEPTSDAPDVIPDSWAWVPFETTVENHDGRRVPVKSSDREKRRGVYPYYGASGAIDTIDDYLFEGEFLLVAEDGANLLSRSTPIAFSATGRFWVNNHAHVVCSRTGVELRYLEAHLNSIDLQDYVTGTAQPKLTQAALNRIPIALPSTEEQREILRRVDALFDIARRIEAHVTAAIGTAEKMPAAILSQAFSGALVPTEAELARAEGRSYETAEELLDRVRRERDAAGETSGVRPAFGARRNRATERRVR